MTDQDKGVLLVKTSEYKLYQKDGRTYKEPITHTVIPPGQDEYVVFLRDDGYQFYFKNTSLHREYGPAIVIPNDKEKYSNLGDENLYKKVFSFKELIDNYGKDNFDTTLRMIRITDSYHYLNDKPISEEDFDKFLLKRDLENSLASSSTDPKKVKI